MDTCYSYGVNPSQLRPKYYEGIELIRRAWTSTEPFAFNGEFNKHRYVNPVPRPYQKPHPPIWIPGGGSVETWDYCAENDFVYGALTYYGAKLVRETVAGYWNRVEAHGKDYNPNRLAVTQFVGVADTDAEAYRLYKEPAEYFFNRSLHVFPGFTDPPGYVTEASVRARYKSQVRNAVRAKQAAHDLTFDEMVENGYVVIGGPDTVREQLEEAAKDLNIGNLCAMLQFGNMNDELTRYNTQLFGEKVATGTARHVLGLGASLLAGQRGGPVMSNTIVYLPGIAGDAGVSPALQQLVDDGRRVVIPDVPGLRRRAPGSSLPPTTSTGWRCSGTRSTPPAPPPTDRSTSWPPPWAA